MRIKDNKDLEYTKNPGGIIALRGEFDIDTRKMFLVGFKRVSKQKLRLDLKTENSEKMAWIRAKNLRGVALTTSSTFFGKGGEDW